MRGRVQTDGSTPREARHDFWGVVVEGPDGPGLGRFYADLLGWEVVSEAADGCAVAPPDGVAYLGFQTAPDYVRPVWPTADGEQQMMLHLDFEVSDLARAVADALALGAQEADFQPQDDVRVMLDPAGHPFCLYTGEE
jgi:catechol 2,3-dioxygenase-like lactoylglutathione lyase family enzyme